MSKLDEIQSQYYLSDKTRNTLEKSDVSGNNKYFEYMVKMWSKKPSGNSVTTLTKLIQAVADFHKLLPYIDVENRDIYDSKFTNFNYLVSVVTEAELKRSEKLFDREKNCDILFESDNYLMLRPLTYEASIRYGANTKWCTSAKKSSGTFERYTKDGLLCYLINKKNDKLDNYNKIAFYADYVQDPMNGEVTVYNALDKQISTYELMNNGWKKDEIIEFICMYRMYKFNVTQLKYSKDYLNKFVNTLEKIDLGSVYEHVQNLAGNKCDNEIGSFIATLNGFKHKIKTITDVSR